MVKMIYVGANTLEQQEKYVQYIQCTCQSETSSCTLRDALFDDKFRVGTKIALAVMFWHEVAGNNAIMLYSNQMLDTMG